jgi:protein-S-isoprenylcysteine O-methyltransferase Ste14
VGAVDEVRNPRQSRGNGAEANMRDEVAKRDKRLLPPVYFLLAIILMLLLHFFLPVVRWHWWPWNLLGVVAMLLGVVVNIVADNQFKRHKTTVKPFQRSSVLVTDGLFRVSRNPMYLGMVCSLIGLAVCLASLTPFVVIPLFAWWLTVAFILPEERNLADQFGETYNAYTTQVRRWL